MNFNIRPRPGRKSAVKTIVELTDITGFYRTEFIYKIGAPVDLSVRSDDMQAIAALKKGGLFLLGKDDNAIVEHDGGITKIALNCFFFRGKHWGFYKPYDDLVEYKITPLRDLVDPKPRFFRLEKEGYKKNTKEGMKVRVNKYEANGLIRPGDVVCYGADRELFRVSDIKPYIKKDKTISESVVWMHCVDPCWSKLGK